MSRTEFQKSVRMFHKFSDETMRRRSGDQAGRESVAALAALESVLKAERPFSGDLIEPLAAFTNLLQSSQLPPDFGNFSFGDGLLAIEEAQAELRQTSEQRWEFTPELSAAVPAVFVPQRPSGKADAEHEKKLARALREASERCEPGSALVVGALSAVELPLAELAARFTRLTLSDVDLPALQGLVERVIPHELRDRVALERYDASGTLLAFDAAVQAVTTNAASEAEAVEQLTALLESYDVGAGSAGLSSLEEKPDLAVSALLLSELGAGLAPCVSNALEARGWAGAQARVGALASGLELWRCLLQQHHVQALLRRAKSALLVSAVSEVRLRAGAGGKSTAEGEPRDLLFVERLSERLPQIAEIKAEHSWERRQDPPAGEKNPSLLTLVEAVLV